MGVGGAAGAAGAAGGVAATTQAIRASGAIVVVEPGEFLTILRKQDKPLVVHAKGGFLSSNHRYLTSYRGLAFFCKSGKSLDLPDDTELIEAGRIWVPGST